MPRTLWLKRVRRGVPAGRTHAAATMLCEPVWTDDGHAPRIGRACRDVYEVLRAKNPDALFNPGGVPLVCPFCDHVNDQGEICDKLGAVADMSKRTITAEPRIIILGMPDLPPNDVLRHDGLKLEPFKGISRDLGEVGSP